MFTLLKNPNIIINTDKNPCIKTNGLKVMNAMTVNIKATPSFMTIQILLIIRVYARVLLFFLVSLCL